MVSSDSFGTGWAGMGRRQALVRRLDVGTA
jgi:hypothetical protein